MSRYPADHLARLRQADLLAESAHARLVRQVRAARPTRTWPLLPARTIR